MNIKEESNFGSENERDTKDLTKKIKIETSDSYIKSEVEDSQHHLMTFNETIRESETKIDIKEEHGWLETTSCVHDDIKDETHEDFYSTKPPSAYKGVSTYTSEFFSSEDLGNDISFNMKKDNPECESDRKYQSQNSVATVTSSTETSVCSETCNDGKIVRMTSSSKQSKSVLSHENRKSCNSNHEGIKPHKCNICNKAYIMLGNLKRHKLSHEGIKPHKCNICNKAFTELGNLKTHKLYHEGIKPHKCDICNKAFTQLGHLKTHKLYHEGIKPHKCDICNKAFTQLGNLKRHKLSHEGIKPHKCDICNKAFTASSTLKRHKLNHKSINPQMQQSPQCLYYIITFENTQIDS